MVNLIDILMGIFGNSKYGAAGNFPFGSVMGGLPQGMGAGDPFGSFAGGLLGPGGQNAPFGLSGGLPPFQQIFTKGGGIMGGGTPSGPFGAGGTTRTTGQKQPFGSVAGNLMQRGSKK